MYEPDYRTVSATASTPTQIDLVKYPHCTRMVTIQVKLLNFTYLPHDHRLAFSVSQPLSFKEIHKWTLILEINFSLYGDSWPAEQSWPCRQYLAAFGVPNTTPMPSSLIPYYTVPTASCSDAIIRRNEVQHSFLHTYNTQWRQRQHHTNLTIRSKSYGHMVGASTVE